MPYMDEKEKLFALQLAREIAKNKDVILEIFQKSTVGRCGGKCKGYNEEDPVNLCPECLRALEKESETIFSVSPAMKLFADVMNTKN